MSQAGEVNQDITDILKAVAERDDQEQVIEIEEKTVQLVVFLLDGKYYAFQGELIKEIVAVHEISYVPGMPEYLPGVINVRGEIESVVDLRMVLGIQPHPLTKQSRVAIGEVHNIRSGILVDSVEDVLEIAVDQIVQPESGLHARYGDYIQGEASYHGHELVLLDLEKFLNDLLRE